MGTRWTGRGLWAEGLGCLLLLLAACGGDEPPPPPPPPEPIFATALYDVRDPCNARIPLPADVLDDALGRSSAASCPTDPLDRAMAEANADEGAPLDSRVTIPVDGPLDSLTVTATAGFSLTATTGGGGTALPPIVVLERVATETATSPAGWALLRFTPQVEPTGLSLRFTAGTLKNGGYYVVVLTDVLATSERGKKPLVAAPATDLLLGSAPIAAGALEGLDEAAAGRLERERSRLQPVLAVLAGARPAITREHIRSIHGFRTALGPLRLTQALGRLKAAIAAGRVTYQATAQGGDISPDTLFPPGTPLARYSDILAFRKGTIRVPRLLDADGHLIQEPTSADSVEVPFLAAIPENAPRYPAAVYLAGYNRSKLDLREIANDAAKGSRTAMLGLDLRCFGDRAPDASGVCGENRTPDQVAMLPDTNPNGNPEFAPNAADGIPDASGQGFFPADPRKLRDAQLAAILELTFILDMLQTGMGSNALDMAGVRVNTAQVHLIAAGQAAHVGLAASALTTPALDTVQFPSGGVGLKALIAEGPERVRMLATPSGVTDLAAYLTRAEAEVLGSVSFERFAPAAAERYVRGMNSPRALLNFGGLAQFVPMSARQALSTALSLPTSRQSRHNGNCDTFYVHQCRVGDNIAWLETARSQIAAFIGSGGVTVVPPAQ